MDLLNMSNLCGGATLAAIAFCCSTKKPCPYRDKALEILKISKEDYERVKKSFNYGDNRLCFKSLAFCCSLEVKCDRRDEVLKDMGMSPGDYIAFKNLVLNELGKCSKLSQDEFKKLIEEEVVCYKFIGNLVPVNQEKNLYIVIALGNPEIDPALRIIYWEEREEDKNEIGEIRRMSNQIVSIRLEEDLLHDLDILSHKTKKPRSQLIREILRRAVKAEKSSNHVIDIMENR